MSPRTKKTAAGQSRTDWTDVGPATFKLCPTTHCSVLIEPEQGICENCLASRLSEWVKHEVINATQLAAIEAAWRAGGLAAADAIVEELRREELRSLGGG